MGQFTNYYSYVSQEAKDLFEEYKQDLLNDITNGESVEVHEFFDDRAHSWVDNDFIYINLHDCADILDSSNEVESDSGLWEGLDPLKAIEAMAFFTYRNDLMYAVKEVAAEELEEKKRELEGELEDLESDKKFLEDRGGRLEEEQEELDEDAEDYDEEYDRLEQEIDGVNAEVSQAEEAISEKEEVIQYFEDVVDSL